MYHLQAFHSIRAHPYLIIERSTFPPRSSVGPGNRSLGADTVLVVVAPFARSLLADLFRFIQVINAARRTETSRLALNVAATEPLGFDFARKRFLLFNFSSSELLASIVKSSWFAGKVARS